jgi:hypothetical protein
MLVPLQREFQCHTKDWDKSIYQVVKDISLDSLTQRTRRNSSVYIFSVQLLVHRATTILTTWFSQAVEGSKI